MKGQNGPSRDEEDLQSYERLTREELLAQFLQLKKDHAFLEKDKANLEAMYHETLAKERERSRLEKETLEQTAMDIFQAVGELSEEKTKAEREKKIIETSALDIAQAVGELSQEKNKAEEEKRMIENSALDIAQAVGELSQEKNKVEEEKRMIENSAMDIAQAVGEISEEKARIQYEKQLIESSAMDIIKNLTEMSVRQAEELRASFVPPPLPAPPPVTPNANLQEYKVALQKGLEQLRTMKGEYTLLLQKIYPAHFLPVLENREAFLPSGQVTVLVVTIADFYQHLITMNSVRLARFIKKLSCDIQGILHQFGGWLVAYNHNSYQSVFGSPGNPRAHTLEAAQAAVEVMKYGANCGFKLSVRLHTGPMVLGDFGSPERPQYHCLGELLAYLELMKKTEQGRPQSIILTEQLYSSLRFFFDAEKLDPVGVKGHGVIQVYRLRGPMSAASNPHRVEPGGYLASKYPTLCREIQEKREAAFKGWNFEKIEVRDGSLGTGEAIAFYAIAFAREQHLAVNEDLLLRAAFLLNIGKMSIPKAVLNNPASPPGEKKLLANLYGFTLALLSRNPSFRDVAELIADFRGEIDAVKRPEAQALKVAAAFEGISFPKIYKTNISSLKQAVNIFRNAFPHPLYRKFLEMMGK
jgi:class 3 adenylate cyclase